MSKGKLIVLCGTDGSGKATQVKILAERLKKEGHDVETVDFPDYGTKAASLVEMYLNGDFGTAEEVGPYRASILYAAERYASSRKMKLWLDEGKVIISNRYVSANIGHQGGKIKDKTEREKFIKWVHELEFDIFKIPKPDINLFLYVPPEIGLKLLESRGKSEDVKGARDMHEEDTQHLKDAEQAYLYAANNLDNWKKIDCTKDKKILSKEVIAEMVSEEADKIIKKP